RHFGLELYLAETLAEKLMSRKMSMKSFSESEFYAESNGDSVVPSRRIGPELWKVMYCACEDLSS
ncbi:Hypothetical predicted protein, partial [Paramuricea clavata]